MAAAEPGPLWLAEAAAEGSRDVGRDRLPGSPAAALAPVPRRVLHRRQDTRDTVTLWLEPGSERFRPGQFNMLYPFGVGEVPISISGDPGCQDELVHTIRSVGLTTAALCRSRAGDWVGVRGPFGSAWPIDRARGADVVIAAGGLGMAPLRPAVQAVLRQRAEHGRVALLYGARTPADLLYRRELRALAGRSDLDVRITVDAAPAGWPGDVGVAAALVRRARFDPASTVAMVCGPEVMMRFTIAELRKAGLPESAIWLSMERNMQCAVGLCGHCQFGPAFVCRDGPVFRLDQVSRLFGVREV